MSIEGMFLKRERPWYLRALWHWAGFSVVYIFAYVFFAFSFIQPDNYWIDATTFIFLIIVPTIPFLVAAIYLASKPRTIATSVAFVLFLGIHYFVTLYLLYLDLSTGNNLAHDLRLLKAAYPITLFLLAWYLTGQILIWLRFLRK